MGGNYMGLIVAFIAGFFMGGRGGTEGFEEVMGALKSVGESDEVAFLLKALRAHTGHVLQELGKWLESEAGEPLSMFTVIEKVRGFADGEATGTSS
jgi:hypothetical protein